LRVGSARWRPYASVLVIPRRKTSLCEALHRRRPWPELELPWEPMGSSPERGRRGKGKRKQGHGLWAAWGATRAVGGRHGEGLRAACGCLVLCSCAVCENRKQEGEEEKEEREKKKKRKEKKRGKKEKI
jgi:hypothetical protein